MARSVPYVYWDACCFIAYLNKEPTTLDVYLIALDSCIQDMESSLCGIVLSTMHRIEVKQFKEGIASPPYFELLQNRNCIEFNVSPSASILAEELQDRTAERADVLNLKEKDAKHLAVAIEARCDAFFTTEPKLVRLYEMGIVPEIRICFPYAIQPRLPF